MRLRTDDGEARYRALLTVLLGAVVLVGATDIALDLPQDPGIVHIGLEALLILVSLGGIVYVWAGWMRTRHTLEETLEASERTRGERDVWRTRAETLLRGLGTEIDNQLQSWHLSPAERETALLLLKGYGHKQIAGLLGKSERTVRQQAVAVYRKSGLSGRAELAAFFLEDLMLPTTERRLGDDATSEEPIPVSAAAQTAER